MSDFVVRPLADSELRDAQTMFRATLHTPPSGDEEWALFENTFAPERFLGVISGGAVVGTTYTFPSSIAVPGGETLPMAAVSRVGVRADHTRRGILTELMRFQLTDAKERGEVLASLYASESVIYGRFGYGVSTYNRGVRLRGARVRPEVPSSGQVRIVSTDEAIALVPGLYERIGLHRPGMITRGTDWWPLAVRSLRPPDPAVTVVHSGPDGDDGFLVYGMESDRGFDSPPDGVILTVLDLQGATAGVRNDLWRYLFNVDLVGEVRASDRPVDETLGLILVDPRKCKTASVDDDLWLRLIDVKAALSARSYGAAEPVVLAVRDKFLPDNSGTYRISSDGVTLTDSEPELVLDVDVLAMIYLGAAKPSDLAAAGRLRVIDPDALARVDRLFATDQTAWCGTGF